MADMKTTTIGDVSCCGLREYLQRELAERCANNPQYSLRGFARLLGVDHSTLSQLLRGKRRLTAGTVQAFCQRLGISSDEAERFVLFEERIGHESPDMPSDARVRQEVFDTVVEWQHFAILELTRLKCFRPDSRWISRVLDISVDEVNQALALLLHLNLLRMETRATWQDSAKDAVLLGERLPANAAEDLARRLSSPDALRDQSSLMVSSSTIAIDRQRLPIVMKYLERVRKDIADLLGGESADCDDVYRVEILMYPVTTIHQENIDGQSGDTVSDFGQES